MEIHTIIKQFAQQVKVDISPLPKTPADASEMKTLLTVAFVFGAAVSLLVMVIGGFRFILSRGDPSGTAQGRNAIIYGAIGLLVVATAASIVAIVITGVK